MTTSPAPDPAGRERPRHAGRAVGHLAEGELAPLAVAPDRDEGEPRRLGRVDELAHEAHSGADQRSPRLSRSSPSQAKSIAISTSSARGVSGWSVHQLAID